MASAGGSTRSRRDGMGLYRDDARALERLVEPDRVHRDVYTDREVFQLEVERLWPRTWIYVGHASQVPQAGDYITLDIAAQPLIMVRQADGSIRVLLNRCAHKGTKLVSAPSGNTGRTFRCPYHAWTYRIDGSLVQVPLKEGSEGTRLQPQGLDVITNLEVYRGFGLAGLSPAGLG